MLRNHFSFRWIFGTSILIFWILMTVRGEDFVCQHGIINQGLCQQMCRNDTCDCSMVGQTTISSCTQSCFWHNNRPCPNMACEGANSCNQHCFWGQCNMKCHNTLECSQTCSFRADCGHLFCSAKKCYQVCSDCSMECSEDVTRCEQMCLGGVCDMKCHAKKCKRMCNEHSSCNTIGQSSSSRLIRGDSILIVALIGLHYGNR